jgi:hypothetical protein
MLRKNFNYPKEWDVASDTLTDFAKGVSGKVPKLWTKGGQYAAQMAGTGKETTASDQYHTATNLANQAGRTGFETAVPSEWKNAGSTAANMVGQRGLPTSASWQSNLGSNLASMTVETGLATQDPAAWLQALQTAGSMADSGLSVDQDPWYQQAKEVAQRDITRSIQEAAEQAGLSGMRWSTPMGRQAQDITAERMGEVGLEWTNRELAAQEAARQRMLEGSSQLFNIGQGQAGLDEAAAGRQIQGTSQLLQAGEAERAAQEAARQRMLTANEQLYNVGAGKAGLGEAAAGRQMESIGALTTLSEQDRAAQEAARARQMEAINQMYQYGQGRVNMAETAKDRSMQAAGQLQGLGSLYFNAPMETAQNMQNLSQQYQSGEQAQLDKLNEEYSRLMQENNPWLKSLMAALGTPENMAANSQGSGLESLIPLLGLL